MLRLDKASGLRWSSFMATIPLPWARRRWALPFPTILAPSQRYDDPKGRPHKGPTDWARQGILQIKRWLPDRFIIIVADSSFSAIELIAAARRHVWYGGQRCRLEIATGTAIWYHSGQPPVPIRWVLVGDPAGIRKPQVFPVHRPRDRIGTLEPSCC